MWCDCSVSEAEIFITFYQIGKVKFVLGNDLHYYTSGTGINLRTENNTRKTYCVAVRANDFLPSKSL